MVKNIQKKVLKVIEKAVRRIFSGNERIVAADSRSSASVVIGWVREAADTYLASQRRSNVGIGTWSNSEFE